MPPTPTLPSLLFPQHINLFCVYTHAPVYVQLHALLLLLYSHCCCCYTHIVAVVILTRCLSRQPCVLLHIPVCSFRSSYFYCTCCFAGREYTITFLRFCKQVSRHSLSPIRLLSANQLSPTHSELCWIARHCHCYSRDTGCALTSLLAHSSTDSMLLLVAGYAAVLCGEADNGSHDHYPTGVRSVPRRQL